MVIFLALHKRGKLGIVGQARHYRPELTPQKEAQRKRQSRQSTQWCKTGTRPQRGARNRRGPKGCKDQETADGPPE